MNITFFAKRPFIGRRDQLMRGSSIIRAQQIAEYLNAKCVWVSNYGADLFQSEDLCIYVKPGLDDKTVLSKNSYIDLIDSTDYFWLFDHPEVGLITCSETTYDYFSKVLSGNKLVLIPQHHCNFERYRKEPRDIKTVGYIGSFEKFRHDREYIIERCEKLKVKAIFKELYRTREDVCEFYKKIDIQLDWRTRKEIVNPLKLINAGSFGIPTIAYPNSAYREIEGYYLEAGTTDEMFDRLSELIDSPELYTQYSDKLIDKTEQYHIENIAPLYRKLLDSSHLSINPASLSVGKSA